VGIPISPQSFRVINVNLTIDYPNDFTGLFRIRTTIHSDGDLMTLHDLTAESCFLNTKLSVRVEIEKVLL